MRFSTALLLVWAIFIVGMISVNNQTIIMALGFLGRDPTLTSRTVVWDFAIQMIEARPLLGYGYGVFWDSYGGLLKVSHAHNGYISAALDVGLCGAILLVLLINARHVEKRVCCDVFALFHRYLAYSYHDLLDCEQLC